MSPQKGVRQGWQGAQAPPASARTSSLHLSSSYSSLSPSGMHLLPPGPSVRVGECWGNSSSTGNKFCPVFLVCQRRWGSGGPQGQRKPGVLCWGLQLLCGQ